MGDFKFACGNCGQHIAVDETWCGQRLKCPVCQTELEVPNAMPTALPPLPKRAAAPPPPVPPIPQRPSAIASTPIRSQVRGPLCVLAPVSLLLVVATPLVAFIQTMLFPIVPLTPVCLIAGLVCGHMALGRIRRRAMGGKVWAVIGLVLGYLLAVVVALSIGYLIAVKQGWIQPPQSQRQWPGFPNRTSPRPSGQPFPGVQPSRPQFPTPQPNRSTPMPGAPPRSGPAYYRSDVTNNVTGTVGGQPFKCTRARIMGGMLELGQGDDFFPDASVTIFTMLTGDPSGKVVTVPTAAGGISPPLNVRWKENGRSRMEPPVRNYVMRLEFGQKSGNLVPGKIQLEIPGNPPTKISGEFTAEPR